MINKAEFNSQLLYSNTVDNTKKDKDIKKAFEVLKSNFDIIFAMFIFFIGRVVLPNLSNYGISCNFLSEISSYLVFPQETVISIIFSHILLNITITICFNCLALLVVIVGYNIFVCYYLKEDKQNCQVNNKVFNFKTLFTYKSKIQFLN